MRDIEEAACLSRWRDRTVEVCALCFGLALCAVSIPSVFAGGVVFAAVCCLVAVAGVPWAGYLRKLAVAGGFAVVSVLPLSVGVVFWPRFELFLDRSGFETAILAVVRAVATLSVTLLLVHTMPFPRLLVLLRVLRLPEILFELLALVHREIFLLDESFSRLRRALACRDGGRGADHGIHALGLGAAALFVQALRRSERLERGIASRASVDGSMRFWEEPIKVRPLPLSCALGVPAVLAAWIFRGRLGF